MNFGYDDVQIFQICKDEERREFGSNDWKRISRMQFADVVDQEEKTRSEKCGDTKVKKTVIGSNKDRINFARRSNLEFQSGSF